MSDRNQQFLSLFMTNQKRIYNYILMLVPNYADADDIMQETASVLWDKFDEFQPGTNFTGWAINIARIKSLRHWSKKKRSMEFSEDAIERIVAVSEDVLERQDQRTRALRDCLMKLADEDRQLISLRYERGLKLYKVAGIAQRSVSGIYHSMARIHGLLRQCIDRRIASQERI